MSFGQRKYKADGRAVWVEPDEKKADNGDTIISMGFKFCEISETVKDGHIIAAALAELMNQGPQP